MPFINATIGSLLATLMDLIFNIVAWITAQIGYLLDFVVQEMVLNMADLVNEIGAIDSLWQIFRDLGNIVFIGVLLYIAIRTILDVGNSFNTKRLLTRLVIVALFVNFSLFATKVIIDTSNVVALQFYNSIQVEDCGEGTECNISHFFADATNISSVQSAESIDEEAAVQEASSSNFRIALARVLGIIFLLVTAFVMGAMALLLVIRFAVLMLLMIASPLAFIAFILPSAGSWGKKWFDKLLNQSFFAPALFAMIYVVANLASELQSGIADDNTDLMAAVLSPDPGTNFGVLLVFFLMTILMASTLVIAKSMGAAGASKTIEIGQKARNWGQTAIVGGAAGAAGAAARGTIGQGSRWANENLKKSKIGNTAIGNAMLTKPTESLAKKRYGSSKNAFQTKAASRKRKGRLESVKARERTREKVEEASNDAEKRRALGGLSSNEKIDYGKDFLMANANLLSESDIKAIENEDDFSEREKQEIKNSRYDPVKEAAQEAAEAANEGNEEARKSAIGNIKSALGPLSDNEVQNNLNININTTDPKEQDRNQQLIDAMSSSQFDSFKKSKSKDEQKRLTTMRLQPLMNAIRENNVNEYLGDMKEEEIAKLLKMADDGTRSHERVIDEVSPKVLSELADSLKTGEKEKMRTAVYERYTDPNNPQITDKNRRSSEWLDNGPGKALF